MAFAFRLNCEVIYYNEAKRNFAKYKQITKCTQENNTPYLYEPINYALNTIIFLALSIESSINAYLNLHNQSNRKLGAPISRKIAIISDIKKGQGMEGTLPFQQKRVALIFSERNYFVHYKEKVNFSGDHPDSLKRLSLKRIATHLRIGERYLNHLYAELGTETEMMNPTNGEALFVCEYGDFCAYEKIPFENKLKYALRNPIWYLRDRLPQKFRYWLITHNFLQDSKRVPTMQK